MYQKGSESIKNPVGDAIIQARFFEHGLLELIEQVNLKLRKKLTNSTAAQQKVPREPITHLFTFDGQLVTSLVDIPPECCYLLAQTNGNFRPPNIEALIPKDAEVEAGQFA